MQMQVTVRVTLWSSSRFWRKRKEGEERKEDRVANSQVPLTLSLFSLTRRGGTEAPQDRVFSHMPRMVTFKGERGVAWMLGPAARGGTSRAGCMSVGRGRGKHSKCECEEGRSFRHAQVCAMFEDVHVSTLTRREERYYACQHSQQPSIGLLGLFHILPNRINPTARLASEQLQLRRGQVNHICKKTILQTPGVWCMAFNDSYRTSALSTHASLHRLARACVGIWTVDVGV
jgi:hypothetical protein